MDNNFNSNNQNQGSGYGYYNQPYTPIRKNNFALASLILGVCTLILMCTGVFSLITGSLGILFAVLSRRQGRFERPSMMGLVTSAIGFGFSLLMVIMSTVMIFASHTNPNVEAVLDASFESAYGMDFDEFFETSTGVNFDEMMDSLGY